MGQPIAYPRVECTEHTKELGVVLLYFHTHGGLHDLQALVKMVKWGVAWEGGKLPPFPVGVSGLFDSDTMGQLTSRYPPYINSTGI